MASQRLALIVGIFLLLPVVAAAAQGASVTQIPAACNMVKADYSKTVNGSSIVLIPAAPNNVVRTGIFIELLTASATLAINPQGGTASATTPGNILITTGSSAPNNVAYINTASLGFTPQGAITAIADTSSRAVTAYACPQ